MIIAQEKRKNNIGEYILYMWQVEDLIRALKLDMDEIEAKLINNYQVGNDKKTEIRNWYQNLVLMLQKEQKQGHGHLQFLVNLVDELNRFHTALLTSDADYKRIFEDVKPDIELVREKSKQGHHDIEIALNTLYIILMLKMKNKDVTEGTQMAVWKFGNLIGHLSNRFSLYEKGELELEF